VLWESLRVGDLTGKERRVLGVFILMVGAGIILDSDAVWLGTLGVLAGAALLVWGMIAARPHEAASPAAPLAESPPTRSPV